MNQVNGNQDQQVFNADIRDILEQLPKPCDGDVEVMPEELAGYDGETLSETDEAVYDFVQFCRTLSYRVRSVEEAETLWETELRPRLRTVVGPSAFRIQVLALPESESQVADYGREVLMERVTRRRAS